MGDNKNVCSDAAYVNSITMRNRFKLISVPPQRYDNLQNSPYTNNTFTQEQLNMRRKVEILKYSANQSSTKTNNLTKKEKWAQLVNGASQKRNLPYSYIQQNIISGTTNFIQTCPSGTTIYTPTYASNIPGPIMNLYEDPNVPLYMYSKKIDNYGILNQEVNTTQFTYDTNLTDIYYDNNDFELRIFKTLNSLYIQKINTTVYTFNIEVPISLFISAKVKSNVTGTFNETITMKLVFAPINIFYGTNIINTDIFMTLPKLPVTLNVSMNLENGSFSGNQYIGNGFISNLTLNTQPNYVYDIKFASLVLIETEPDTKLYDYFENITYGISMNPSYDILNIFNNCSVVNPSLYPTTTNYKNITIT